MFYFSKQPAKVLLFFEIRKFLGEIIVFAGKKAKKDIFRHSARMCKN